MCFVLHGEELRYCKGSQLAVDGRLLADAADASNLSVTGPATRASFFLCVFLNFSDLNPEDMNPDGGW